MTGTRQTAWPRSGPLSGRWTGLHRPVAAHAVLAGSRLTLRGLNVDGQGYWIETITGPRSQAETLGRTLAEQMRRRDP